ncbi:hypothetical protein Avbf_15557, partial [Armadillidium vulgare]
INEELVGKGGSVDIREQKYTERLLLPVYSASEDLLIEKALVFIGTEDPNLQLGPAPIDEMAKQIAFSRGPSGPNTAYLFNLVKFLKEETPSHEDEDLEDVVWGVAYYISTEKEKEVLKHLDHREKGGYLRCPVTFYSQNQNKEPWQLTIYVGTESNPFYTGAGDDDDDIASIILNSEGPSGPNTEYLFNLVNFMNEIGVKDDHLLTIYDKVTKPGN